MNTSPKMNPLSLHFIDEKVEHSFRESSLPTLTIFARVGLVLALVLYLCFAFLDTWILPEQKESIWLIRAFAACTFLACLFISYSPLFKLHNQAIQFITAMVGGLGLVAMVAIIPLEAVYYYYVGVILAIVFYYVVIGLEFNNALYANLLTIVCYEIVAFTRELPLVMIVNNNFFLIGFSIVAASSGYVMERQRRLSFLQSREMEFLKEKADAANQAKSRFFANMSHELRTPLNAIIGYSEILLEDASNRNDKQEYSDLKSIWNSGRHLLRLINDILDLAKIESGGFELISENTPLAKLLNEIESTALPLATKNNNKIIFHTKNIPHEIQVDSVRLKQILLNLIGNACKFTKKGEITVKVERNENNVIFSVQDTGIGMSPEQLEKIFSEFQQAEASVAVIYGGTGLGLPISKQLVELMGGNISVSSEPGRGSEFQVLLPINIQY
jgi:signal transduction histidine kinase